MSGCDHAIAMERWRCVKSLARCAGGVDAYMTWNRGEHDSSSLSRLKEHVVEVQA